MKLIKIKGEFINPVAITRIRYYQASVVGDKSYSKIHFNDGTSTEIADITPNEILDLINVKK